MTRLEYLKAQKREHGRKVVGVFPALYPKELIWAAGAVPVEIWDPPLTPSEAGAHLQPYICGIVQQGLELVLQGQAALADAFLFPHTCDSIQNLATVVFDYCKLETPCYFFYHPKEPYSQAARDYYRQQLEQLAQGLAKAIGAIKQHNLRQAVKVGQEINHLVRELYDRRAGNELGVSNQDFYRTLRLGEYLMPDDFTPLLQGMLEAEPGRQSGSGPAVVLSGVLPNPIGTLAELDRLGVRVAADDLIALGRRLLVTPSKAEDPWQALTDQYFSLPPCTTRGSSIQRRLEHLLGLVEKTGARGVIFQIVKFCEPEYFDLPILSEELKERGLAVLTLDVEPNQALSGQMVTRLEAFSEMLA
jgi:benzoyl-CoA reductase/2-hydroxyglutaryl-CoA dehydratase subunit BcrC/BadD/HgdB